MLLLKKKKYACVKLEPGPNSTIVEVSGGTFDQEWKCIRHGIMLLKHQLSLDNTRDNVVVIADGSSGCLSTIPPLHVIPADPRAEGSGHCSP
jgi:hypothetical protein